MEFGKLYGISLGADFCAEHEWGIERIKQSMGIDGAVMGFSRERPKHEKPHGLPRRTITKHDSVKLYTDKNRAALLCMAAWAHRDFEKSIVQFGPKKAFERNLPRDLRGGDGRLMTAWDEGGFGICGQDEDAERIKELAKAFEANNIAIWIGGGHVFKNGGLILCIVDRCPAEGANNLREYDLDNERLQKASDETGIIERLQAAERGYMACSPRWKGEKDEKKTAYPVVYWLNPVEQHKNNYGWFTVEELDLWIKGQGPIPK